MHGDVRLGGPVWLFATVLLVGTGLLALFVLVDSLRKRRSPVGVREPLWTYTAGQALYVLVLLAAQVLGTRVAWVAAVAVGLTVPALIQSVAYLLRVVFPSPQAEDGGGEPGQE